MDLNSSPFESPPQWSLDVGFFGRFAIILAIVLFALSVIGWLWTPKIESLKRYAAWGFTLGCVSLFGAFAALATLFIQNRLEFSYVSEHGDSSNSIPYRIAGIWAGQQGSFLLWACCAAFFGLLSVRGTGILRRWFTIPYAGFLGAISSILAYESPFGLNLANGKPVVVDGQGLTPALQNYWVTIHPPTIFLGFGALTVLAAYAFSALASNKPQEWVSMVRPWALTAMTLVGVGLCMGGFWAYETLGWGGFWMWDPVENVSFVPWVFSAALVHGIMVQVTKKRWTNANLLMGGLPFLLFVYGTFLTRSGVLNETSVHSFANMDHTALKLLLGFLITSTVIFLGLWIWRYRQNKIAFDAVSEPASGINREALFKLGAWLLVGLGIGAALGMSWPMIMAIAGQKPKVVEEALYHSTLSWLYVPLMLAMAIGPLVAWRAMPTGEFLKRMYGVFCVTIATVGVMMMIVGRSAWTHSLGPESAVHLPFHMKVGAVPWILGLVSLSVAVLVANVWRICELIRRSKMSAAAFLAHVGVAVLMAGLIISRGFEQKAQIQVREGQHDVGLGYFVSYKGMTRDTYDRENKVLFEVRSGKESWTASPGLYYTQGDDGEKRPMVWPHIQSHPFYDIYFALQPPTNELGVAVTLQPGQTSKINGVPVTYLKLTRDGEPGKPGTKWGALLKIGEGHDAMTVNPKMGISGNDEPASLNDDVQISMQGMQAGANSVTLQLLSTKPIYPVDMFFKPMTILVWLGTGILAFAGLLSAYYRRVRRIAVEEIEPPLRSSQPARSRVGNKPAPARGLVLHKATQRPRR